MTEHTDDRKHLLKVLQEEIGRHDDDVNLQVVLRRAGEALRQEIIKADPDVDVHEFKARPVVVEAIRWTGTNFNQVSGFCRDARVARTYEGDRYIYLDQVDVPEISVHAGDYIVRFVDGCYEVHDPVEFTRRFMPVEGS